MMEWMQLSEAALWWIALGSVAVFLASAIAAPLWIIRLPTDYFIRLRAKYHSKAEQSSSSMLLKILKNIVGILLVLVGVLMLVLPGQGVIAILAGILLMDFPGKYRLVAWICSRPSVWRTLNWIRRRAGKSPLVPARDMLVKNSNG